MPLWPRKSKNENFKFVISGTNNEISKFSLLLQILDVFEVFKKAKKKFTFLYPFNHCALWTCMVMDALFCLEAFKDA